MIYTDPIAWLAAIFGVMTDPITVATMTIVGIASRSRWPLFVWAVVFGGCAIALDRATPAAAVIDGDPTALLRELAAPIGALAVGLTVWGLKKLVLRRRGIVNGRT